MKLRNKKTGEIGWLYCDYISVPKKMTVFSEDKDLSARHWDYTSLAELNEEWEDYEEPKKHYEILAMGAVIELEDDEDEIFRNQAQKEIGNYFSSREEAERAVERLRAWKRLKDKGFKLSAVVDTFFCLDIYMKDEPYEAIKDDLKIVFGGEE